MRKTYLLSGICLLSFGLTACVNTANNDSTVVSETTTEIITESKVIPPCTAGSDDRIMTDDFLTDDFVLAQENGSVALSRPVSKGAVSVKDKQKNVEITQTTETITDEGAQPVVVITKEVKTEETQVSKDASKAVPPEKIEDKKEEKSAEVIPATEVKPDVKVDDKKETESSETKSADLKETDSETISVSERLVPIKKIKTTITETTTRIQDDPNMAKEAKELLDKIHYGEEVHDWKANAGFTLHYLLSDWAEKSGWTVIWKLDRDYNLEAGVIFRGTFTDVSGALVRSFARATPAPIGTFYQGNRVLLITTQEDENAR